MCKRVMDEQNVNVKRGENEIAINNRTKKQEFSVTPHLCLAINNIGKDSYLIEIPKSNSGFPFPDYVLQFIRPFVNELGIDEIIEKLRILNGDIVANSCKRTLATLIHNAVENVENKIFEVLDMIGEKVTTYRVFVKKCAS